MRRLSGNFCHDSSNGHVILFHNRIARQRQQASDIHFHKFAPRHREVALKRDVCDPRNFFTSPPTLPAVTHMMY